MKKYPLYLLSLLAAALLTGCTLTMDEYEITEEDIGFDEPATVETEYGNITYQYQDGVRAITKNVQDYIQLVEHDSILYFAENTPSKWLPNVGDCLAAGCSRKLPYGLNHKVLSRENVGGFYKVVCTTASTDDIYKDLDINIDMDYDPVSLPTLDSIRLDSDLRPLHDENDSVPIINDFSLIDAADSTGFLTRADNKDKDTTLNIPIAVYIGDNIRFTGKVTHEVHQTVHMVEKKKENYREQWVIDKSVTTLDITGGVGKTSGPNIRSTSGPLDPVKMKDYAKQLKEIRNSQKNPFDKKVEIAKIRAMLPTPVPICFVFTFDAGLVFDGAVLGGVTLKFHHAQYKDGFIYNKSGDKKKHKVHSLVKMGYPEVTSLRFMGEATVKAYVRVGVGCEIHGIGLGADVGVKLQAGVEFKYAHDFLGNGDEVYTESAYVRGFVEFIADFEVYVSPLGLNIWSSSVELFNKTVVNEKTHFGPQIDTKKSSRTYTAVVDEETQKWVPQYTNVICFSKLYTFDSYFSRTSTYPRVRVYLNKLDGDYIELKTSGNPKTISGEQVAEADTKYTFVFTPKDLPEGDVKSIICVPCLYDASVKKTTEFRDKTFTFGDAVPKVSYKAKSFKVLDVLKLKDYIMEVEDIDESEWKKRARELFKIPSSVDPDKLYHYSFRSKWNFSNMSFVKEVGFHVKVSDNSGTIIDTEVVVDDGAIRSGTRTVDLEFVTNRYGTDYSKCPSVKVTSYTVTKDGNRKYNEIYKECIGDIALKYPQNNLDEPEPSGNWTSVLVR